MASASVVKTFSTMDSEPACKVCVNIPVNITLNIMAPQRTWPAAPPPPPLLIHIWTQHGWGLLLAKRSEEVRLMARLLARGKRKVRRLAKGKRKVRLLKSRVQRLSLRERIQTLRMGGDAWRRCNDQRKTTVRSVMVLCRPRRPGGLGLAAGLHFGCLCSSPLRPPSQTPLSRAELEIDTALCCSEVATVSAQARGPKLALLAS